MEKVIAEMPLGVVRLKTGNQREFFSQGLLVLKKERAIDRQFLIVGGRHAALAVVVDIIEIHLAFDVGIEPGSKSISPPKDFRFKRKIENDAYVIRVENLDTLARFVVRRALLFNLAMPPKRPSLRLQRAGIDAYLVGQS